MRKRGRNRSTAPAVFCCLSFDISLILFDNQGSMASIKGKILKYTVVYEPAEEGGYIVLVPALPGCFTQGDTIEEARKMAGEAIIGYLQAIRKLKEDLPIEPDGTMVGDVKVPAGAIR